MKRKLQVLIISCIFIVSTLSLIQYYLIRNTYNLTKDQYYREIKLSVEKVLSLPLIGQMKDSAVYRLKNEALSDTGGHFSGKGVLKKFRAYSDIQSERSDSIVRSEMKKYPNLNGVLFKSQIDEIVFKLPGRLDTILSAAELPVVYIGHHFPARGRSSHHWSDYDAFITQTNDIGSKSSGVVINGSSYMDISSMQAEVFKRMTGIFLLAVSMILAISVLFFWMIRMMLNQKKLADMKTDFANNITHELKTPLSSANIITRSLEKKEFREQPVIFDEMLASLKRQHQKIHTIVDTVLDSAMAIDEKAVFEPLNITDYLSDYLENFPSDNRKLVIHIEETEVILKTDRAKLETILNNLIENALKYSAAGLAIYCSSFVSGSEYIIEIKDFGIGIEKSEQVKIFDQFYRVPQENKNDVRGLGLGLYLCCKKAVLIGAALSVTSKPGYGSIFTLKLPLHEI